MSGSDTESEAPQSVSVLEQVLKAGETMCGPCPWPKPWHNYRRNDRIVSFALDPFGGTGRGGSLIATNSKAQYLGDQSSTTTPHHGNNEQCIQKQTETPQHEDTTARTSVSVIDHNNTTARPAVSVIAQCIQTHMKAVGEGSTPSQKRKETTDEEKAADVPAGGTETEETTEAWTQTSRQPEGDSPTA